MTSRVAVAAAIVAATASAASAGATPIPRFSQGPPLVAGGPPRPFGPLPTGTDRFRRTDPGAVASLRGRASRGVATGRFDRGISDGVLLRRASRAGRISLLRQARADGARVVRIPAEWRNLVLSQPRNPRDPLDPAYNFARLDVQVRASAEAGLRPLLVVSHAPGWAEAPGRWHHAPGGAWAVDPRALGAFGAALARRYSGRLVVPRTRRALPRVALFQSWNEPNLPGYLAPQWIGSEGRWVPWAPAHYRRMHNAFLRGVKAVRPEATVASAGLAPNGDAVDGTGRMAPIRFIRSFLCLDPNGRPRREPCADPPVLDAVGFHPLSTGDPDRPAVSGLDVAVADIAKLTGALQTARAAGILRHTPPLWITELNWTSPRGTAAERARWVARAFQRLWRAGAQMAVWQFVRDRDGERPAGLRTASGRPKGPLRGYRFPLDLVREGPHTVRAWMLSPSDGRPVCVARRSGRGWSRLRCARGRAGAPVILRLRVTGPARLRASQDARSSATVPIGR